MADIPMQDGGMPPPGAGKALTTIMNVSGAALSLALVAGIGIWGYQLLMRDVNGVPIVRALEGPMRVAPIDPGGISADHQGLSVNYVAGMGSVESAPDRLILAPKYPGIEDADPVGTPVPELASLREDDVAPVVEPLVPLIPRRFQSASDLEPDRGAAIQALADQIAAGVAPLTPLADADEAETAPANAAVAVAEEADAEQTVVAAPGVPTRSYRPRMRPEGLAGAVRVASASAAAPAEDIEEVDAATLPSGTRLVQLGAFDSPEVARSEWIRLSQRFGDYLQGKSRVVQRAKTGGRVFYRLRALGFSDLSDARRFCAALKAKNADCIPVVTR